MRLQLKSDDLAHSAPVPVPDARVTERLEEREVLLELVQLHLEELRGSLGVGLVGESLGELVHGTPHRPNIIFNLLSIEVKEGAWGGRRKKAREKARERRGERERNVRMKNENGGVIPILIPVKKFCQHYTNIMPSVFSALSEIILSVSHTVHPLVMFLMELSCCVPESVVRLLHVGDHLYLREGGHLPLQQLLLIVDGLYRSQRERERERERERV